MPADPSIDTAPAGRRWYVYYRIPAARQAEALQAVHHAQAQLRVQWPGVSTGVMQRAEAGPAEELTLMECYGLLDTAAHPPAAELAAWVARTVAPQVAPWASGPRHVEIFDPCA